MNNKVLIVADSAYYREKIIYDLQNLPFGFEYFEASNVAEAMDELSARGFLLIITQDEGNGYNCINLIKKVREVTEYRTVRSMVFVPSGNKKTISDALSAGYDGYIESLSDSDQVWQKIADVIDPD